MVLTVHTVCKWENPLFYTILVVQAVDCYNMKPILLCGEYNHS